MAFGLGFALNLAQFTFYEQLFGVAQADLVRFGGVVFLVQAVAIVAFVLVRERRTRGYATLAVAAAPVRKAVPPWALIAPVLPLAFFAGPWHTDALVAFALSALYAVLVTKPREAVRILVASAIRGVEDVAPAVLLMIGIGMLLATTKAPEVAAAVTPLVNAVTPRTPLAFVLVFGLLSPLALYRGPLNPFGVGIAVYTVLASLHAMPATALAAAVMAVVQVQNVCDPTNTQNVWGRELHGRGCRAHHAPHAALSGRGRDGLRARCRRVRRHALRHGAVRARRARTRRLLAHAVGVGRRVGVSRPPRPGERPRRDRRTDRRRAG